MPYSEDILGALALIASIREVKEIMLLESGYYMIEFHDTTATLLIDAREVTLDEIKNVIIEARS